MVKVRVEQVTLYDPRAYLSMRCYSSADVPKHSRFLNAFHTRLLTAFSFIIVTTPRFFMVEVDM